MRKLVIVRRMVIVGGKLTCSCRHVSKSEPYASLLYSLGDSVSKVLSGRNAVSIDTLVSPISFFSICSGPIRSLSILIV